MNAGRGKQGSGGVPGGGVVETYHPVTRSACGRPFSGAREPVPDGPVWTALSSRVLAVAVPDGTGNWTAYIDAVPGVDHAEEWRAVRARGAKLDRGMASALFSFDRARYSP